MSREASLAEARRIILRHGSNATAWQILNPGLSRWTAGNDDGLVGYVDRGGTLVAAGDPVGPPENLRLLGEEFEQSEGARRVCWFSASEEFAREYRDDPGHSTILIGAQPVWHPRNWGEKLQEHPSLRAQLRRAANKGVVVHEWGMKRAAADPDLESCLAAWVNARPFPPLHFLVEPRTLERPEGRRIFVASQEDTPIGYTLLSPIPQRNGWLVEQFVRLPTAPNGTSELMVSHAIETIAAEGFDLVTLGLAPLSHHCGTPGGEDRRLRFLLGWLRLHGHRFYNFQGLDFFKTKFHPDRWEPIFAIANEPRFSLRTLYAIGSAFSDGSPIPRFAQAFFRAARQEGKWFVGRLRGEGR